MQQVHPEISLAEHWNDFFVTRDEGAVQDMRTKPFLPGSLSYHWHNRCAAAAVGDSIRSAARGICPLMPSTRYHPPTRSPLRRYDKGLPATSWAGVLTERYQNLANEKTVCELKSK